MTETKQPKNDFFKGLTAVLTDARRKFQSGNYKVSLPSLRPAPEPRAKKKRGTKNKSQGQSKKRRKMASASNRVNRKRVPGWKH